MFDIYDLDFSQSILIKNQVLFSYYNISYMIILSPIFNITRTNGMDCIYISKYL